MPRLLSHLIGYLIVITNNFTLGGGMGEKMTKTQSITNSIKILIDKILYNRSLVTKTYPYIHL
jgi:hypothetical protein